MNFRIAALTLALFAAESSAATSSFAKDVMVARKLAEDIPCMCIGTSLICNEAEEDHDHEEGEDHDEEMEMEMGGNETDVVVAEAREGHVGEVHFDEICSCETGELVCEEHEEGEHDHEDHSGECHCDGDDVHCETEEAEAECHCHDGEVHCEEHEDGEGDAVVINLDSGATCLAAGGALAVAAVAALM